MHLKILIFINIYLLINSPNVGIDQLILDIQECIKFSTITVNRKNNKCRKARITSAIMKSIIHTDFLYNYINL
jgi:hypothetical protein